MKQTLPPVRPVLLLHGWSDTSESFEALAQRLRDAGRTPVPVWLGDYVSMDDDVTLADVAQRMEAVLQGLVAQGALTPPFDAVVHSTGGLVARLWLARFDRFRDTRWMQRLVMLAPANHGSRLAATGKSMIGRLTKGLGNWFQTGTQVLGALELGSPFQWELVLQDVLHSPELGPAGPACYGVEGCLPFVLTGIRGYQGALRGLLNEAGADGVVRAAAANLSASGATLDFSVSETAPQFTPWARRDALGPYALALLDDEDHSSVVHTPAQRTVGLVLQALECPRTVGAYEALRAAWRRDTWSEEAAQPPHAYLQLNTFVVDDRGAPVSDHFLEFFGPDPATQEQAMAFFHAEVLSHVHRNSTQGACRCLYIDRTDLVDRFYPQLRAASGEEALHLSLSAAPPGPNARYFASTAVGAAGHWKLHAQDAQGRWLQRHSTHYLRIVIPRVAADGVFQARPWS